MADLRGLNLPHMPLNDDDGPPSIRILVVADADLQSAASLAEFTLMQNGKLFEASMLDLCLACGPFSCEDDLLPYLQPNSPMEQHSREGTIALEGLVTSALSQLESIVCRVLYIPGPTDPLTLLMKNEQEQHKRLTPNSRNVHQQWLPLVPGLGCAGLSFLDEENAALESELGQLFLVQQQKER